MKRNYLTYKMNNKENYEPKFLIKWVVALRSEATLIINLFKMKLKSECKLFKIYCNSDESHCLVISGIGKINSAAATIYLSQKTKLKEWAFWINIGIAGYKENNLGELYVIDKIIDNTSDKNYYPSFIIDNNVKRASLLTLEKVKSSHYEDLIYDMEGSGFFEIANKIIHKEFILIIKIISDTPKNNIENINKKMIEELFEKKKDKILEIINQIELFSSEEKKKLYLPEIFELILQKWKFSESQKSRLKFLIRRLNACKILDNISEEINLLSNSNQVINYLTYRLKKIEIDWSKN